MNTETRGFWSTVARAVGLRRNPTPAPVSPAPTTVQVGPRPMAIDAIINLMAGAGTPFDRAKATQWAFAATENWQTLTNLTRASWLAKKIITARYDDMLRGGVLLDWDDRDPRGKQSDAMKKAITRWQSMAKVREALYYKAQYGGSIIVIGIRGEGEKADLTKPLPIKDGSVDYSVIGKGGLRYLHVFDRWRCQNNGMIDTDIESPNCGRPLFHVLTDIGATELQGQQVHWSRVIRFDGAWVPWVTWRGNGMWMDSELQVVLEVLKNYDTVTSAIATLIFDANVDVIKSANLVKHMGDADGEQAVQRRWLHAATHKSLYRMLLLDKDEEDYQRFPFAFAGLDKIWEKFMLDVAGATGYPVARLFGQAPAGLNATGESDMRNYAMTTAASRESDLRPRITSLLEVLAVNEFGYVPPGFEVSFPPIGEPTAAEKATMEAQRAARDKLYIDALAIQPQLVARQLKEDGVYSVMEDADVDMIAELDRPLPPEEPGTPATPPSAAEPAKPGETEEEPAEA